MGRFLLRRIAWMVPTFLGITLLTFGLLKLAPGDPMALGGDGPATAGEVEARRRARGDDRPVWEQYARWVGRVAVLDFGRSLQDGRPVAARIAEALPTTLLLAGLALLLSYALAVPLGAFAAARRGGWFDRALGAGTFTLYALPAFWVAVMLLSFLATDRGVRLFPLQGLTSPGFEAFGAGRRIADVAWHLVLPVAVLAYAPLAVVSRMVRVSVVEALRSDYVRTARAKGLSERAVVYRHALRNALSPVVTLLGLALPYLVGGSVIVEQVFGIPGMGLLAFDALRARDDALVMGITTLVALLTLASTLLADLVQALIDPRVALEGTQ